MAQLIDIEKVTISPRTLSAEVRFGEDAPLYTGDSPEGTKLVAALIPELANHACYGDGGATFGEVMDNTELAHLLEHVTVELLARTNRAGSISAGQTRAIDAQSGLFELRLACPDDVLVAGALSSASWIIDWAYSGGSDPEPDVDAIVQGLVALIDGLDGKVGEAEVAADAEPEAEPEDADATIISAPVNEADLAPEVEPLDQSAAAVAAEPETATEPEDAAASGDLDEPEEDDPWKGENIPAPRFVR